MNNKNTTNTNTSLDPNEIDEAYRLCFQIIDNPPPEYRIIKQAIQGLVHLSATQKHLRPLVILKLLEVVRDPTTYRSNPRRYAVRSFGYLTYHDEDLIVPSIKMLLQLVDRKKENSQYVRKAAFCALSRIGRKYPVFQKLLIDLHKDFFASPHEKISVKWGVLIGLGRMAQSNSLLRSQFAPEWIKCCYDINFRIRWAGIKGLGHAVCPIGNVVNDEVLENQCFNIARDLLRHGGEPTVSSLYADIPIGQPIPIELQEHWKNDKVYLVQYGAISALGFLLRSNPDKWWNILSPIFTEILVNPNYAAIVKCSVMLTYGKIAYCMKSDNAYFQGLKDLLFELSTYDNILVSEPATYALCNISLAHEELYPLVKSMIKDKIGTDNLFNASEHALTYYLKTWCKLIAKDYNPVLNLCSTVISTHTSDKISGFSTSVGAQNIELLEDNVAHSTNVQESPEALVKKIARNDDLLLKLCTGYSSSVLESIILLLSNPSLFENKQFLTNLIVLIKDYKSRNDLSVPGVDQRGLLNCYRIIKDMEIIQRQGAVMALQFPDVLENQLWISQLKNVLVNKNKQGSAIISNLTVDNKPIRRTKTSKRAYEGDNLPASKKVKKPPVVWTDDLEEEEDEDLDNLGSLELNIYESSPPQQPIPKQKPNTKIPVTRKNNYSSMNAKKPRQPIPEQKPKPKVPVTRKKNTAYKDENPFDNLFVESPLVSNLVTSDVNYFDTGNVESEESADVEADGSKSNKKKGTNNNNNNKGKQDSNNNRNNKNNRNNNNKKGKNNKRNRAKKRKKKNNRKPKKPKEVCRYYLMRKCSKGDTCTFLHEGNQIVYDDLCKFYRSGYCQKGDTCPFSHGILNSFEYY
eukprot:TRINITY_DN5413_c0_g1_i1.p1 TRINITY_DN5413_c0_g1~~TRINITY_DN5413_c0_g1_i1.p1  ORF type:complete len:859 (-),score=156.03 TRINITY_DN5413_c0_g1_i1:683-3259(-)